jgi:hypothetical protein
MIYEAPHYAEFFSLQHFLFLMSKYSPSNPVLKHPQSMFFPQFDRPSFISIKKKQKNYSSVYFNLEVFRQKTGRQNILD